MKTGPCELCGQHRPLQEHHVITRGIGGAHVISHEWNVLNVCNECHRIIHDEGTGGVLRIVIARLRGTTQERVREKMRELRNAL